MRKLLLAGIALLGLAGAAIAQAPEAPSRGIRLPDQSESAGPRGIRMPEQAAPAAPAATRAAAAAAPAFSEAAAACLLRHGAKAAGNTEAWRDIRRICTLYPGVE